MNKSQEALNELKDFVHSELDGTRMLDKYLGYVNTLQQLVDKETPKKVKVFKENDKVVGKIESYRCPTCSYHELFIKFIDINMVGKYKSNYCEVCGQKLDWSDE